ncbi:MAG: dual specificity protein phosphatase family protein [Acidimicrobiia bacterium]|nr:dual specificity protein phosphatase family protein [Acidimicrobiia bacterium]
MTAPTTPSHDTTSSHPTTADTAGGALSTDAVRWWRTLCTVTAGLAVSGDLHPNRLDAIRQLQQWRTAGVTDILDVRGEWTDADLVASVAPDIAYHHLGVNDAGTPRDPAWFDAGAAIARTTAARSDSTLVVHCHMGINRAPSMVLAILLDRGWDPIDALTVIRHARPIAAVAYADDAIAWHHQRHHTPHLLNDDLTRLHQWQATNRIDTATVIRRIRAATTPPEHPTSGPPRRQRRPTLGARP